MNDEKNETKSKTVAAWLLDYRHRTHTITWLLAGLGGEIAMFAALGLSTSMNIPSWLAAIAPSSIILAGAFLGRARAQFDWRARLLEYNLAMKKITNDEEIANVDKGILSKDERKWPQGSEILYYCGFSLMVLAAIFLLVIIFWPVVADPI